MGEGRCLLDNTSASSDDSVRVPPPLDLTRVKPGPGALPSDAFDPLKHNEWEQFWHTVDQHFQPINEDHIRNLGSISINPYNGLRDPELRLLQETEYHIQEPGLDSKRKESRDAKRQFTSQMSSQETKRNTVLKAVAEDSSVNGLRTTLSANTGLPVTPWLQNDSSTLLGSLNSFPFTHRLVAALLDECNNGSPAPSPIISRSTRVSSASDECLWTGISNETENRSYQAVLEDRVKLVLSENDLLDISGEDAVQSMLRNEQWKLRDIKTMNRIRKGALHNRILLPELRQQAIDREVKRHCDQVEMVYLTRMLRNMKKNKKSRSKVQKLLQRMFGHYNGKDKPNDKAKKTGESMITGRLITNGDEKARGGTKKKKRRTDSKGPPNLSVANGTSPGETTQ